MAINKKLLNEGESIVFSTRTHVKALFVPALVLIVVAGAAGYGMGQIDNKIVRYVIAAVALVVIVVYTLWPFLKWMTATYTVTNRRLTTHQGVISRTGHDIPLSRISDVSYEKGLLDRLLGCGTLVVSDASEQGRVQLTDVPQVEKRQLQLSDLLFHGGAQQDPKHDDGT
ncbi:PH domain-containing protein [Nocardioides marmorisolisilvae]|uniref:PH domain-containing protein n=1 Tax=Nocardioides marmorisolisilvae TaxID=1542737 RepID=A0A3N0DSJ9_9ACTN|nr:PH domain-containing protein [Nocardioides marmorisolisilvae]RNL78608.1 PH domain-containing protein [Nocardioides marmorisolisilvae]